MNTKFENILTIGWSIKLGLKINARIFIFWCTLSISVALLPAIALLYNREAVSILSNFLTSGQGYFGDIVPSLVILGIILTAIGISKRINGSFLYIIMYDAYYHGMQEYLMDVINSIEIKNLMKKEFNEDYYAAAHRCGSLADFMSSGTLFLSKFAGAVSLLVVALSVSGVVFTVAALYVILIIVFNILMPINCAGTTAHITKFADWPTITKVLSCLSVWQRNCVCTAWAMKISKNGIRLMSG